MAAVVCKHIFLVLALALACARGLIAPGLMLEADPAKGLIVVVCKSHDFGERLFMTADGAFVLESELPPEAEDGPCPFGVSIAAIDAPSPLLVASRVAFADAAIAFPNDNVAIGRGLAAPPPPAIGPPLRELTV